MICVAVDDPHKAKVYRKRFETENDAMQWLYLNLPTDVRAQWWIEDERMSDLPITQFCGRVCRWGDSYAISVPIAVFKMDKMQIGDSVTVNILEFVKKEELE